MGLLPEWELLLLIPGEVGGCGVVIDPGRKCVVEEGGSFDGCSSDWQLA